MNVPWIAKEEISRKATGLLKAFQSAAGYRVKPPIPVEEIIERTLGLKLIYADLTKILGAGDVLGATYVESRTVCINERLFEEGGEGRLVFTCAHEAGHWALHRRYVAAQGNGAKRRDKRAIVCRAAESKAPIEWQADYFAACLLMPEREMRKAFMEVCGPDPLIIRSVGSAGESGPHTEPRLEQWPLISAAMCEAAGFANVSKQAMIIRLEELGLLINKTPGRLDWQTLVALED